MTEVSIDPNVWGPMLWDTLFYILFNTNIHVFATELVQLLNALEVMLPCSHCRRHYAVYKKQVPVPSNVKAGAQDSLARWLWIIHDMVNQNLGKICISYEKVVKKHTSCTCIISDFNIFDIVVFVWMVSKNNKKVLDGLNTYIKLLAGIRPFKTCAILNSEINENLSFERIHKLKSDLLSWYDFPGVTLVDMKSSYEAARAI